METDISPKVLVALYDNLPEAEAALNDLQAAGVPYHNIRMATHSNDEVDAAIIGAPLPADGRFWSLAITFNPGQRDKLQEVLRTHGPFVLGLQRAAELGRDEVDQGRIAWGHYVFSTSFATDQVADAAGTAGTTGVISSGAFSTGAENERQVPKT